MAKYDARTNTAGKMKIDEFKKGMDDMFGDRHINLPAGINFDDIGLYNMPVSQFISTYTKLIRCQLSTYAYKKKDIISILFKKWWITGDKKCRFWFNHYACNDDGLMVQEYEAKNSVIKVPQDKQGAPDIEKTAYKIAVLQSLPILAASKLYTAADNNTNITQELLMDISKTAQEYGK